MWLRGWQLREGLQIGSTSTVVVGVGGADTRGMRSCRGGLGGAASGRLGDAASRRHTRGGPYAQCVAGPGELEDDSDPTAVSEVDSEDESELEAG